MDSNDQPFERLVSQIGGLLDPLLRAFEKLGESMSSAVQSFIDLNSTLSSFASAVNDHMLGPRSKWQDYDLPWGARRFAGLLRSWSRSTGTNHVWVREGRAVECARCHFSMKAGPNPSLCGNKTPDVDSTLSVTGRLIASVTT